MKITNVFIGTAGQDPRSGAFDDGRSWANVRIAVNHDYFNGATGEVVNRGVSWFDVSAYGALARNLAFSVRKGDSIIVVGELRMRDWEKDGRTGTSGTIIADVVGPNLLFGVSKYMRSSALIPDTPDPEAGDGSGTSGADRRNGAWGKLGAPAEARGTASGGGFSESATVPPPAVETDSTESTSTADLDGEASGSDADEGAAAKEPAEAPF